MKRAYTAAVRTVKAKPIKPPKVHHEPKARRGSFKHLVCLLEELRRELMAVSTVIVAAQAELNSKIDALDAKVSALVVLSPADEKSIADGITASGAKVDAISAKVNP